MNIILYLQSLLAYERVLDVDSWFMVRTPVPILTVLLCYLCFVLRVGPEWMSSRKPFNLKSVLIVYNFIALVMSAKIAFDLLWSDAMPYVFVKICAKQIPNTIRLQNCECAWQYLILKIFELLDTVFFVLRKKQNQVTVLHVYHHTTVVIITWMYLHYYPVPTGSVAAIVNCFIHVPMYLYYLLSALGPQYQKYLWWKKYMTLAQILQFVVMLGFYSYLYVYDCGVPIVMVVTYLTNFTIFTILFTNFYIQRYRVAGKKLHAK